MPTTIKDESRPQSADFSQTYRKPSVNYLLRMIFRDSGHLHNEH